MSEKIKEAIKALFLKNPADEIGPSDEPDSVHRFGYNSALEDALDAIEKAESLLASSALDLSAEREQFEAWHVEHVSRKPRLNAPSGLFEDDKKAWAAWQARAALNAPATPSAEPMTMEEYKRKRQEGWTGNATPSAEADPLSDEGQRALYLRSPVEASSGQASPAAPSSDAQRIEKAVREALDNWTIDDGTNKAFEGCVQDVLAAIAAQEKT
ncbi:hypothetical protein BURKHO8Y_110235 [Burkholderia sp. 8Y]|uniref:hypothetical protein n=1 Tax=Burkholderia sp. 8Y TaxID=2653133 RepID=UPI0012F45825|nr:hypothetical protein [Burkholderia sp. 8Y]VXB23499.1 hypothetical protein BURKHO8Y_110235 [Burkholderia sp. 8Y]